MKKSSITELFSAGRYDDALALGLKILRTSSNGRLEALQVCGSIYFKRKKFELALRHFADALKILPSNPNLKANVAAAHIELRNYVAAEPLLREALDSNPGDPSLLNNYASLLSSLGRTREAIACLQDGAATYSNSELLLNLAALNLREGAFDASRALAAKARALDGVNLLRSFEIEISACMRAGDTDEAIEISDSLCHENARNFAVLALHCRTLMMANLNNVAVQQFNKSAWASTPDRDSKVLKAQILSKVDEEGSLRLYEEVLLLDSADKGALDGLSALLYNMGRYSQVVNLAESAFHRGVESALLGNNYSASLVALGRLEEARSHLETLIIQHPFDLDPYRTLSGALCLLNNPEEAKKVAEIGLRLAPTDSGILANLALAHLKLAEHGEARTIYQKLFERERIDKKLISNRLFALNYDPEPTLEEVCRLYAEMGAGYAVPSPYSYVDGRRTRTVGEKIRLGYISPNLNNHSLLSFIEPIFRCHNRSRFELNAIICSPRRDGVTDYLLSFFDSSLDITNLGDSEAAALIHAQDLDILIDLAGHTDQNRLGVLAHKPTRTQVSYYIGYAEQTGLKEVDYLLIDNELIARDEEQNYVEAIARLDTPGFVYRPNPMAPMKVSEPPFLVKGYITFGSFTRLERLNKRVIEAWRLILELVSGSRLRLDQRIFRHKTDREYFAERLKREGFPVDRLDLVCSEPYFSGFEHIDIVLDTWPHNSGTTLIESIWSGVPFVTMSGRAMVGRVGSTILRPLNLENWIAHSPEDYVELATTHAKDSHGLILLRKQLREKCKSSDICNEQGFITKYETALEALLR